MELFSRIVIIFYHMFIDTVKSFIYDGMEFCVFLKQRIFWVDFEYFMEYDIILNGAKLPVFYDGNSSVTRNSLLALLVHFLNRSLREILLKKILGTVNT